MLLVIVIFNKAWLVMFKKIDVMIKFHFQNCDDISGGRAMVFQMAVR